MGKNDFLTPKAVRLLSAAAAASVELCSITPNLNKRELSICTCFRHAIDGLGLPLAAACVLLVPVHLAGKW